MKRLRELIAITHRHGVELSREIRELTMRRAKLAKLNEQRRRELHPNEKLITMYDSVDVGQIPDKPEAVAGYVGGKYATYSEIQRRFPVARKLSIAVTAAQVGSCLDVETGDATPADAPPWVRRMKRIGVRRPCLYANLSTMPTVKRELLRAGILLKEVRLWVADPDGSYQHIPPGYDACQWWWKAKGRNLDQSVCREDFFDG